MFDMFKGMGQIAGLLRNLPKIQEEMQKSQERIGQLVEEGDAGAGMVKVKVNGNYEMVSCTISEEALKLGDREMLEDMVKAAANKALKRVQEWHREETSRVVMGLGMPPGFKMPGMG